MVIAATPPSSLEYNVTSLLPFTSYNFSVMACTSVGCVESPSLIEMTLEDSEWSFYVSVCVCVRGE